MDWSDERYVRLYTRDTADWVSWPWQSRALFPNLMRKADRAGRVEKGRGGVRTLASLVGLPESVVRVGLEGLLADGCVVEKGSMLVIRNFQPAQEAAKSDAARQREHREKERSKALEPGESESRRTTDVTPVTNGHVSVTPTSALAVLAEPSDPNTPPTPRVLERVMAGVQNEVGVAWRVFFRWQEAFIAEADRKEHPDAKSEKRLVELQRVDEFTENDLMRVIEGAQAEIVARRGDRSGFNRAANVRIAQLFRDADSVRSFMRWAPTRNQREPEKPARQLDYSHAERFSRWIMEHGDARSEEADEEFERLYAEQQAAGSRPAEAMHA